MLNDHKGVRHDTRKGCGRNITCPKKQRLGLKYILHRAATRTVRDDWSGTRGPDDPARRQSRGNLRTASWRYSLIHKTADFPTTDQAAEKSSPSKLTGKIRKKRPGLGRMGWKAPAHQAQGVPAPQKPQTSIRSSVCCSLVPGGWLAECGETNLFSFSFQPTFQVRGWGKGTFNKIPITEVIQEKLSVSEII